MTQASPIPGFTRSIMNLPDVALDPDMHVMCLMYTLLSVALGQPGRSSPSPNPMLGISSPESPKTRNLYGLQAARTRERLFGKILQLFGVLCQVISTQPKCSQPPLHRSGRCQAPGCQPELMGPFGVDLGGKVHLLQDLASGVVGFLFCGIGFEGLKLHWSHLH